MNGLFIIAGVIAVISAAMAVSRANAVHALLYLVVSLLAVAMIFFILGAPFAAVLEVIIYAGAIMVLFVFVIMMLNVNGARWQEKQLLKPSAWVFPVMLILILAVELISVMRPGAKQYYQIIMVGPVQVGIDLLGPYLLGVELASMLLLAGLVGAYHLAVHIGNNRRGGCSQ
jgi:NADH-quinone oxidoreductase subunit J